MSNDSRQTDGRLSLHEFAKLRLHSASRRPSPSGLNDLLDRLNWQIEQGAKVTRETAQVRDGWTAFRPWDAERDSPLDERVPIRSTVATNGGKPFLRPGETAEPRFRDGEVMIYVTPDQGRGFYEIDPEDWSERSRAWAGVESARIDDDSAEYISVTAIVNRMVAEGIGDPSGVLKNPRTGWLQPHIRQTPGQPIEVNGATFPSAWALRQAEKIASEKRKEKAATAPRKHRRP